MVLNDGTLSKLFLVNERLTEELKKGLFGTW